MTDLIKFMGGDDVSYSASAGKKTAKLKKRKICPSLSVTACWGDFNSKFFARQKILQNPFLGSQWSP